ncbi:HAD hydrolase-like protein [Succinivibrio dextrinosolvens]|uniref:HAD hydrolase-like protein n=1 Tax=Succinivibrio dextrinosolvens TaxID=83771 RepID=UPI001922D444|nr:HAD hydrolase-like protein [Succinivibrio dextrinosolvens]
MNRTNIKVLLFDLDGTLINTDMLESFRSLSHPLYGTPEYKKAIEDALSQHNSTKERERIIYFNDWCMTELKKLVPYIGVVTKSPRDYAETVLKWAYPKTDFDIIVAHECVEKQKPAPNSIYFALNGFYRKYNISKEDRNPNEVLYVGNENSDIETAYNAGVLSGIKLNDLQNRIELNLKLIPDFEIHNFSELKNVLTSPNELLPIMEYGFEDVTDVLFRAPFRYETKTDWNKESYEIMVAGRYFPVDTPFGLKRKYHRLSQEILDNKDSLSYSDKWLEALRILLTNETEASLIEDNYKVILTCIPKRKGQPDKLEHLLEKLRDYLETHPVNTDCEIHICPDLLAYTENAISNHKEAKTKERRFKNVKNNLFVKRTELLGDMNKVIVIDDVVTTGASLIGASQKIEKVILNLPVVRFAFAQTFSMVK